MDRLKRKLGGGVPVELVFPPRATTAETTTTAPSVQTQSRMHGQRRVTVHYGPTTSHTRSASNADGALGSIIESADEHGASCSEEFGYAAAAAVASSAGATTTATATVATKTPKPRKSPPAAKDTAVDIDIDAKLRGMMKNIGAKRKAWTRKGLADNEYTTLWL
jgi:hypothetical protein